MLKIAKNDELPPYMESPYLAALPAKVEGAVNKGVLLPGRLIKALNSCDKQYSNPAFENFGPVRKTDTVEILETALGLEIAPEKALKTARLLLA